MALPIVPGSEVSTPSSGVRMDSSAFRNAALAPGRVAAAIGQDVGNLFEDISQKVQANKNARMVFDADLAMRKTKDDFTADLAKMPDEGTWLPAYKERVDGLRQTVLDNPHAGPDVRRLLSQKFDVWEATTTSEIRTAALLKGAKETRESAIADATYAAHQGDLEGAHNTLNAAVAHYAMTPAEAKKISTRFPSIAAQAQADTAIETNPIQAPDLIKRFEKTIEPAVFVGIMSKANAARNRAQSDNLNDLSEQMANSPDGTIDPGLLKAKVKEGAITQKGVDSLVARMKRESVAEDKDKASLVDLDITEHDFVADKTPEKTQAAMTERIAGIANPGLRAHLTQKLQSKMQVAEKRGESEERPVVKEQLEFMKQDFDAGMAFVPTTQGKPAVAGMLPFGWSDTPAEAPKSVAGGIKGVEKMTDAEFEDAFGKDTKRSDVIEAARLNYARKQKAFLDWAHDPANKDATPADAAAERQRLERPDVEAAVKQALQPHPDVTEADYAKLKKGDLYWWMGKQVPKQ